MKVASWSLAVVVCALSLPARSAVPLYAMYRPSNTDWLYTTDANERSVALSSLGYVDNGIAAYCDPTDNGSAPLFRFWKGPPQNEHFYTTDPGERDFVIANGYSYEGVQCWVWSSQVAGTAPFYRMSRFDGSTGDLAHFYTTDQNAVSQKQGEGYQLEGVQAYVYTSSPTAPFACNFDFDFASCGFTEQYFGDQTPGTPGRASIVNGAVRLHTETSDTNVHGSGTWERNDLSLGVRPEYCHEGQEEWWAHSVLFPDDYVFPFGDRAQGVLFDFHSHSNTTSDEASAPNFDLSAIPGVGLRLQGVSGDPANFTIRFQWPVTDPYGASGNVAHNVWYDFVYHVRWATDSSGFFEAWLNGHRIAARFNGATLYPGYSCYLKLAHYHSPVGVATSLFHDRVIRGNSAGEVTRWPLDP